MVFATVLPLYYVPYRRLPWMMLSCGLRYCPCIDSLLWTLSKTTLDEAFDVVFDTIPALLLDDRPHRRLYTSDEVFDVAFDASLLFYGGPYQRVPRMRLSIWSSVPFLHCFLTVDPIERRPRMRPSMWSSTTTSDEAFDVSSMLFFFVMDPIEDNLG